VLLVFHLHPHRDRRRAGIGSRGSRQPRRGAGWLGGPGRRDAGVTVLRSAGRRGGRGEPAEVALLRAAGLLAESALRHATRRCTGRRSTRTARRSKGQQPFESRISEAEFLSVQGRGQLSTRRDVHRSAGRSPSRTTGGPKLIPNQACARGCSSSVTPVCSRSAPSTTTFGAGQREWQFRRAIVGAV
jgi:hypothetical protein